MFFCKGPGLKNMEISKKYIKLCSNKDIQNLCRWNSGDRFLIKSQELFCFLEKILGWGKDSKYIVWVPNYETNFEILEEDLIWVPNLSQVISAIKAKAIDLEKLSIEYINNKWSFKAYINSNKLEAKSVQTSDKTAKAACLKGLLKIVNLYNS